MVVALRPDLAPKHVAQIKKLVRDGAYDNVAFHRVIEGFMAQTGDVEFGELELLALQAFARELPSLLVRQRALRARR